MGWELWVVAWGLGGQSAGAVGRGLWPMAVGCGCPLHETTQENFELCYFPLQRGWLHPDDTRGPAGPLLACGPGARARGGEQPPFVVVLLQLCDQNLLPPRPYDLHPLATWLPELDT